MNGVIKVLVSFYCKDQEGAFEHHRSRVIVDLEKQSNVTSLKKHLIDFLGLKEQAKKFGLGPFALKLYRLAKASGGGKAVENFAIVSDSRWKLEAVSLIAEESNSELNVHVIQEDVNWTGKYGIVIPRPAQRAESPSTSGAA
ncbi:Hypothetical predicted protein [Paramuricea clavata]|uniref:Uncharacterized protein n=1 Tax=Paramuricea clavata TaxID=317549 RepID=A0A7D9IY16_PARCT|nr:Hypothetical predicted protein [Paramuricea clavata]